MKIWNGSRKFDFTMGLSVQCSAVRCFQRPKTVPKCLLFDPHWIPGHLVINFITILYRVLLNATKSYHKRFAVVLRNQKRKVLCFMFYILFSRVDSVNSSIFTKRSKFATPPRSTSINNRLHIPLVNTDTYKDLSDDEQKRFCEE